MENQDRLISLDGLRGIAILLVMGHHYFYTQPSIDPRSDTHPFGDAFSGILIFQYGGLGVSLFFLISGFVIALTLRRSALPSDFFVRRFARIWPPLLVCSLTSFFVLSALATPYSLSNPIQWLDFIPTLTLTPGSMWFHILGPVGLVDDVQWTIQVEAKFYILAAAIYWGVSKDNFARNLGLFTVGSIVLRGILSRLIPGSATIFNSVFITDFMPWFTAGATFYELYCDRISAKLSAILLLFSFAVIARTSFYMFGSPTVLIAASATFFILFFCVARKPQYVTIFESRPLVWVGICSYSVYLLHNRIGNSLVSSIPKELSVVIQVLLVVAVIFAMLLLGHVSFKFVEQPSRKRLTRMWKAGRRETSMQPSA
jgi:peptidoglycan/LPS O-acetylase OafA/YrhL